MSERRFSDRPELASWAVRGLALDHPAMVENRTLFPSTVVEVTKERLVIANDPGAGAYLLARYALLKLGERRGRKAAAEAAYRIGDELVGKGIPDEC